MFVEVACGSYEKTGVGLVPPVEPGGEHQEIVAVAGYEDAVLGDREAQLLLVGKT